MNKRVLLLLLSLFFLSSLNAVDAPRLKGYVNDYAGLLSYQTTSTISAKLKSLEESDSTQIFILTIPSLEGMDIETYSLEVAEAWKPGQKKLDNGILFVLAKNERRMRIEVGYGLEGVVTDLLAGRIIDEIAAPYFRSGNFDGGITAVADALVDVVKGEFDSTTVVKRTKNSDELMSIIIFLLIIGFIIIKVITAISKKAGAASGLVIGAAAPIIAGTFNPLFIIIFAFIGMGMAFIPMWLIFYILMSGRGGSSESGGFSGGGGGSFGGGGASGGW